MSITDYQNLKKLEHWLVSQKIFTVELILANDGSNDATIEILNETKKNLKKKKFVQLKFLILNTEDILRPYLIVIENLQMK